MAKKRRRAKPAGSVASVAGPAVTPESRPPSSAGPRTAESAASVRPNRASHLLIAACLLYQIAMPLRYYVGGRGTDERFSWRMFSSVRLQKCDVRVSEIVAGETREVRLGEAVQIAWIAMLERNRPQVVQKLLRRRCAGAGVKQARYRRTCRETDGNQLPPLELGMDCKNGAISRLQGQ